MVIISLILTDPSEMDIYSDNYPLEEYSSCLKCLTSINKLSAKLATNKNLSNVENRDFPDLSSFVGIQKYQNAIIKQINTLYWDNECESTRKMLKSILDGIETWLEKFERSEIDILDFLGLSLVSLVEIPPYEISAKNSRGQFNTPLDLTFILVEQSLAATQRKEDIDNKILFNQKILDPAMGTGMILFVTLEWLVNFRLKLPIEQENISLMQLRQFLFSKHLTGFDIDIKMVEYSKRIFQIYLNTPVDSSDGLESFIKTDFLSEYSKKTDVSEKSKQFDIVISNPPYIALHSRFIKNTERDVYLSNMKNIIPDFFGLRDNLYVAFLGVALLHVTPPDDGVVGFVIDRSFLDLPSYKSLRQTLLDKFNIYYLLENYKYEYAVVDLAVIVLSKSDFQMEEFFYQESIEKSRSTQKSSEFRTNINYSYRISANTKSKKLIDRIKASSISLDTICKISCGLEYGSLLKSNFLSPKAKKDFFPVLDGANGLPYSYLLFWIPNQNNSYVRFSKEYESELIKMNRNISPTSGKRVYLISGEIERFKNPKLVLRQTASKFIGSYDEKGLFALRNLHLIYDTKKPYSLKLILGILTSEFGSFIGRESNIIRVGSNQSHRYPQIRIGDLKQFPVVNIKKGENYYKNEIENIERIVDENLQIGRVLSKAYTEVWNLINLNVNNFPLSSQKRIFHLPKDVDKLSFKNKNAKEEFLTVNQNISKLENKISENCLELNKHVLKMYGVSDHDWFNGLK